MGMLEPGIDHVIDVTMGSERVSGEASGMVILGVYPLGPSDYADGLAVTSSSSGGDSIAGIFTGIAGAVGGLLPDSPMGKIKSAAVRTACDAAGCDVLGYPMFYVDETNYFLWKEIHVRVVGFPGMIGEVKNVPRKFTVKDSYWRDDVHFHDGHDHDGHGGDAGK